MARKKYNEKVRRDPSYFKPERFKHFKTTKELAVSLKVDPSWLLKLERSGRIPRPATVKRGRINIRLYSPENESEIKTILERKL